MLDKFISVNEVHCDDINLEVTYDFEYLEDSYANWFSTDANFTRSYFESREIWNYLKRICRCSGARDKSSRNKKITQKDKNQTIFDRKTGRLLPEAKPYIDDRQLLKVNHPLYILAESKNEKLLGHEVVQALSATKWHDLGLFVYVIDFLVYMTFLLLFTTFMLKSDAPYQFTYNGQNFTELDEVCPDIIASGKLSQVLTLGHRYFDPSNLLEIALLITSILVLVDFDDCSKQTGIRQNWQWQLGGVCLFIAWMVLLLFVRKSPYLGIYIILFLKVLRTYISSSVIYGLFVMAFSLTFYVLLSNHPIFQTVLLSASKSIAMTIGEIDYDNVIEPHTQLFFGEPGTYSGEIPYIIVTYVVYGLFMFLLGVIVMNLMIGLAVDDIKRTLQEAELTKQRMQIYMTLAIEATLPMQFTRRFIRNSVSWNPNSRYRFLMLKWWRTYGFIHVSENVQNQVKKDFIGNMRKKILDLNTKVDNLFVQFDNLYSTLDKIIYNQKFYLNSARQAEISSASDSDASRSVIGD
ncbi:hypothetical protein Ciccas_006505 [Cichlidogyrus casuarinus]|uniref:Ion transport domain-containing protein n=1 Tax=Cichlidogyrus casuarinus TaxID=1844966 RepID=A0ABD2Q5K0_9PLAT